MARNPPSGRQPPTTAAGAGAAPRLAALCAHLGTETQRRGVGWTALSSTPAAAGGAAAQMLSPARVMVGGGPIASVPQEQANACVARALERGVREFDTAAAYGESEVRIGVALHVGWLEIDRAARMYTRSFQVLLATRRRALQAL